MKYSVSALPKVNRVKKKLHVALQKAINDEVEKIAENPYIGEPKKGDLAGVWVHKFKHYGLLYLIVEVPGVYVDDGSGMVGGGQRVEAAIPGAGVDAAVAVDGRTHVDPAAGDEGVLDVTVDVYGQDVLHRVGVDRPVGTQGRGRPIGGPACRARPFQAAVRIQGIDIVVGVCPAEIDSAVGADGGR